jgi:hypothetical protein
MAPPISRHSCRPLVVPCVQLKGQPVHNGGCAYVGRPLTCSARGATTGTTPPAPGRISCGYDFPYWFKSLATLGCPAPRVLAALRAATPGGTRMGTAKSGSARPPQECPSSTAHVKVASRRYAIGQARTLTRTAPSGLGSYGRAREVRQPWTSFGPKVPSASGKQRTTADTGGHSPGSNQGRQADLADLGVKGSRVQISPARQVNVGLSATAVSVVAAGQRVRFADAAAVLAMAVCPICLVGWIGRLGLLAKLAVSAGADRLHEPHRTVDDRQAAGQPDGRPSTGDQSLISCGRW